MFRPIRRVRLVSNRGHSRLRPRGASNPTTNSVGRIWHPPSTGAPQAAYRVRGFLASAAKTTFRRRREANLGAIIPKLGLETLRTGWLNWTTGIALVENWDSYERAVCTFPRDGLSYSHH